MVATTVTFNVGELEKVLMIVDSSVSNNFLSFMTMFFSIPQLVVTLFILLTVLVVIISLISLVRRM